MADSPLRDDGVTIACPVCGALVPASGRKRFCSHTCRQAAWRRQQQTAPTMVALPPRPTRMALTVYECPGCEARLLGQQRCPECNLWTHRLDLGGLCPHCDEPVTLADLGFEVSS